MDVVETTHRRRVDEKVGIIIKTTHDAELFRYTMTRKYNYYRCGFLWLKVKVYESSWNRSDTLVGIFNSMTEAKVVIKLLS